MLNTKIKKIPLAVKIFAGFVAVLAFVNIGNIVFYYQFSKVSNINRASADTFARMTHEKRIRDNLSEMSTYLGLLTTIPISGLGDEKAIAGKLQEEMVYKSRVAMGQTRDQKIQNLETVVKEFERYNDLYFERLENNQHRLAYQVMISDTVKDQLLQMESLTRRIPQIDNHYSGEFERLMRQSYYLARIKNSQNIIPFVWDSTFSIRPNHPATEDVFDNLNTKLDTLRLWDVIGMVTEAEDRIIQIRGMRAYIERIDSLFHTLDAKERLIMAELLAETTARQRKTGKFIIYGNLIIALLSLLVAMYLANLIASPLHRLRQATHRASLGKYDQKLDITTRDEVGGLVRDFNYMMDALSQLDEMKSHFMASVTHDLKSPLNRIKQRMANIEDGVYGDVPEWMFEQIGLFHKDVNTLLNLVHNHLDIEKIESGKFSLSLKANNIKKFLKASVSNHVVSYQAKGVGLYLKIDVDEKTILFDDEHLSRVFDNLLTNCLKYSSRGDTVRVIAQRNEDMLVVSIADEGPGVPDNMKSYIFDKFYQIPGESKKGSGLGLTITRQIIEEHGGWIKIVDNEPRGAKFLFAIPIIPKG